MLKVGRAWESNFDWKETDLSPSQAAEVLTNEGVKDCLPTEKGMEWVDVNINANGKRPHEVDITTREVAGMLAA